MGWKLFQSSAASLGFGTEKTVASYIVGDCLVGHTGCVEFLKLCKTFGVTVLLNISGGILYGL